MLRRFANRTNDDGRAAKAATLTHEAPAVDEGAMPKAMSSLAAGMSITGNIVCDGPMQVFGRIEGDVRAGEIEIGDGAEVEGNITAQDLTIRGHVKGTIRAVRVRLLGNGKVDGDIFHRALSIAEPARFEGSSRPVENPMEVVIETRVEPVETRPSGPQLRSIFKPSLAPIGDVAHDTSAA
ncbi:MAG TPA: polymer-forming cytoskeletal protein [Xanthobacteraceae bacterium]|nr:polymer-forming cytoskeletal protein [Xanthobacteraceae bacterium]